MSRPDAEGTVENRGRLCRSCGAALSDRFCAVCGEDSDQGPQPLASLARQVAGEVTDIDGRLAATLTGLLRRPGALTRQYFDGARGQQVPPIRLYLALSAVYFFCSPLLGSGILRYQDASGSFGWSEFGPLMWRSQWIFLALVPSWAVLLQLALIDRRRYFEEAFVFSVHYHAFFLLWMLVLVVVAAGAGRLLPWSVANFLMFCGILAPLAYLGVALRTGFDLPRWRSWATAVLLFYLQQMLGQSLQSWLGRS